MRNSKKINFFIYFLMCTQATLFNIPLASFAENNLSNISINTDYLKVKEKKDFYILGPGDILSIKVTLVQSDLDINFMVDKEGYAQLNRLGRVYVEGLTINELTDLLNKEYSKFIKSPDIELNFVSYRPLTFYIDGEIIRPGSYVFKLQSLIDRKNKTINKEIIYPRIIDAIKLSGGITHNANLTNIKVKRINSITNGGGKISTQIDLSKVINLEDTSQNIRIYDGDTIYVQKSNDPVAKQIGKAMKSNLNPENIRIFVGGRVNKPGVLIAPRGSTLNDAIMMSGGSKIIKGPVQFTRYNGEEDFEKRKFRLNNKAVKGSYENPFLNEGDVVYVGKNLFNITSEVIADVTEPFRGIFTFYGLYKVIED